MEPPPKWGGWKRSSEPPPPPQVNFLRALDLSSRARHLRGCVCSEVALGVQVWYWGTLGRKVKSTGHRHAGRTLCFRVSVLSGRTGAACTPRATFAARARGPNIYPPPNTHNAPSGEQTLWPQTLYQRPSFRQTKHNQDGKQSTASASLTSALYGLSREGGGGGQGMLQKMGGGEPSSTNSIRKERCFWTRGLQRVLGWSGVGGRKPPIGVCGEGPVGQGAQPMPSHRPPDGNCQPQRHL